MSINNRNNDYKNVNKDYNLISHMKLKMIGCDFEAFHRLLDCRDMDELIKFHRETVNMLNNNLLNYNNMNNKLDNQHNKQINSQIRSKDYIIDNSISNECNEFNVCSVCSVCNAEFNSNKDI